MDNISEQTEFKYQVDVHDPQIASDIAEVVLNLHERKFLALVHLMRKGRSTEILFPSLANFDLHDFNERGKKSQVSRKGRKQYPLVNPKLGTFVFQSGKLPDSPLGDFYTESRFFDRKGEALELGGPNLYCSVDQKLGVTDKIKVMQNDLMVGLETISKIDRKNLTSEDLPLYLGILNILKTHSICIFNAITYPEREGKQETSEGYLEAKTQSKDLTIQITRMYYQAMLGMNFDNGNQDLRNITNKLLQYMNENIDPGEVHRFILPEATNPLSIMLGASETALRNPDTETIIGIQSGGIEAAVVLQMAYETYYSSNKPSLIFAPISVHSKNYEAMTPEQVLSILLPHKELISERNVVLVDDNTNTGTTLELTNFALQKLHGKSNSAFIVELDPERILDKLKRTFAKPTALVKVKHHNYKSTLGKVYTDVNGLIQERLTKWYKRE